MADKSIRKKRGHAGASSRPLKKFKKQRHYQSDSSEPEEAQDFAAVNLDDSEDDIANAKVDDGAATDSDHSDDDATAVASPAAPRSKALVKKGRAKKDVEDDAASGSDPLGDDDDDDDADDDDDEDDGDASDLDPSTRKRSKRNDPSAFATSLSKILSTKLSTTKRVDPVLARSADAQSSARAVADSALELKARKKLKDQKAKALEKGRVRDVMGGGEEAGPGGSVAAVMEEERRLRKVAQRGVVKLFNAVRAAQVKAGEAERKTRADKVIGTGRREEKVNEMTKKGFLDLIASGGGGPKRAQIEGA